MAQNLNKEEARKFRKSLKPVDQVKLNHILEVIDCYESGENRYTISKCSNFSLSSVCNIIDN